MLKTRTIFQSIAICVAAMLCGSAAARQVAAQQEASPAVGIVAQILAGEKRNLQFGPHKWRVLEVRGDKALIITEDIVGKRQYHSAIEDMEVYGSRNTVRGPDILTWANCDVRRYLNTAFLKKFTADEKKMIYEVEIQQASNAVRLEGGGYKSKEKVILLSIPEATAYFSGDDDRATGSWWWLRTPGRNLNSTATVLESGAIGPNGETVRSGFGGIRPALWLDLSESPGNRKK
jgi:hypothetical protein